jgi:hypothetical protein
MARRSCSRAVKKTGRSPLGLDHRWCSPPQEHLELERYLKKVRTAVERQSATTHSTVRISRSYALHHLGPVIPATSTRGTRCSQLAQAADLFGNQHIRSELLAAGLGEYEESLDRVLLFRGALSTESYSVHPCVHDWCLASLNRPIDPQSYWYAFDCVAQLTDLAGWESAGLLAPITPHAVRLTHHSFDSTRQSIDDHRLNKLLGILFFGSTCDTFPSFVVCSAQSSASHHTS